MVGGGGVRGRGKVWGGGGLEEDTVGISSTRNYSSGLKRKDGACGVLVVGFIV
jgi:hypothetical protein